MPHVSSLQSHGDRGWSIHYLVSNIQTNHLCFPAWSILSLATAWRYEELFLWHFLIVTVYLCFAMGLNLLLVPQFLKFCWHDLFPATRVLFPCTTSSIFALGSSPPRCYIATAAECLIIITRPKPATMWYIIYMCIIKNHNIIIISICSLPPRCDASFSSSHSHRCLHYHRLKNHH